MIMLRPPEIPVVGWRVYTRAEVDQMSGDELCWAWHQLHKERERLNISILEYPTLNFFTMQRLVLIARAIQGAEQAAKTFIDSSL